MTLATIRPNQVYPSTGKLRVALYSHDTMGLGHIRRNLLIAQAIGAGNPAAEILLINGSREGAKFALPANTDVLVLPAVYKNPDGRYASRSLPVSLPELVRLRSSTICAALETFRPNVLIVDNVPRGMGGELDATLMSLRVRGGTRCVLGLRDVLDEPALIQYQWRKSANEQAILEYYDAVWVYGDSIVYDAASEYRFAPEVVAKVRYIGYLDQSKRAATSQGGRTGWSRAPGVPKEKYVLCLLGGGQDGQRLAENFLQSQLPAGVLGVLVVGPLMDPEKRAHLHKLARWGRFRVLDSTDGTGGLVESADRVVAMGGYNTVGELLSWKKRALVVPRVSPRKEQLIRAERLHELGLLEMLHPDDLSPEALSRWFASGSRPVERVCDRVDFNALDRLPLLVNEVVAQPPSLAWDGRQKGGLLRVAH